MSFEKVVSQVVGRVASDPEVHSAIKYMAPDNVIKATRQGKFRSGERGSTVLVTFGKPNYAERLFIKKLKAAGEPFPVKKLQLR
jgi:hypothetical protein